MKEANSGKVPMRIDSYSFGQMQIGGQSYRTDTIVFPDKINSNWWRRQGHSLSKGDIQEILEFNPDVLVIGTGASGLMQVPDSTKKLLEEAGIEIIVKRTGQAWRVFNEQLEKGRKAVGAFHLTC